jgi:hypothetical protein
VKTSYKNVAEMFADHMVREKAFTTACLLNADREMREAGWSDAERFDALAWMQAYYDKLLAEIAEQGREKLFGGRSADQTIS